MGSPHRTMSETAARTTESDASIVAGGTVTPCAAAVARKPPTASLAIARTCSAFSASVTIPSAGMETSITPASVWVHATYAFTVSPSLCGVHSALLLGTHPGLGAMVSQRLYRRAHKFDDFPSGGRTESRRPRLRVRGGDSSTRRTSRGLARRRGLLDTLHRLRDTIDRVPNEWEGLLKVP